MERRLKVLITGANGQLGKDMTNLLLEENYKVYAFSRQELDITNEIQVNTVMEEIKPDVVIHTAAYTKVDLAESEPDEAYRVNAFGTRNIAVASESVGAKLVYVSTDYVLNGEGNKPYTEYDEVDPINVYGKSKLAGEQMVRDFHTKFFIVRTSWVYGKHGNNFVKTMLNLAQNQDTISVVNDQIGCPTYTVDLAKTILGLIETSKYGIYHVSNSGSCSWFEFAQAIFNEANMKVNLLPVKSDQFPRPAKRPSYSVFNHMSLRTNDFTTPRNWKDGLASFLKEYLR
ncbi:dTDP-4-dehydrorhamnose reductase [Tepidibacillus marianensis]|uniref:dTDP-4-dehydrorhamnose reductase n=1 Tax=Tepidibacillus marianensis TaxID=3131995 RepID=UPI0030CE23C3